MRRSLMSAITIGVAPVLSKICQAISLSTESKALVRSSIHMLVWRVWPLSHVPLHTRCKLNSAPAWSEATLLVKKIV